jgi:peptidoglycan/xylan/chitin deacetylase (PgdA/CDA1 family)
MYHHVGTNPNPVFRTEEGFLKDLTRLEKLGFRPVTIAEYLAGCPYLQAGASPVVFTFDDSNPDQLRLLPDGEVDPHCFMGLWLEFAKTHPDFPPKATFFVIPSSFFGQRPLWDKKLALLQSWGCQIANHTITHPDFRRISDARVEREIALCDAWLEAHGAGRDAPLALPYGEKPHNRELLRGFEYKGRDVHPVAVLNVGSNPARMPGQPGFDPLNLPRIQAGEHRYELDYWLDRAETGKTHSYVAPAPGP